MSNPAVTKLVRGRIDGMSFWMDDHIGESIHIHLGAFRLDLSAEALHELSEELKDTLNELIAVEGFDCRKGNAAVSEITVRIVFSDDHVIHIGQFRHPLPPLRGQSPDVFRTGFCALLRGILYQYGSRVVFCNGTRQAAGYDPALSDRTQTARTGTAQDDSESDREPPHPR